MDELIGANVARLRGDRTQLEVANEMRDLGWRWSQATMWAVEKGERPLRLAESEHLCHVLGIKLEELTRDSVVGEYLDARAKVVAAKDFIVVYVDKLLKAQVALREMSADPSFKLPSNDGIFDVEALLAIDPYSLVDFVREESGNDG